MPSPLTVVARKHNLSETTLASALDAVLTAGTHAPVTVEATSEAERALSLAVLLVESLRLPEVADRLGLPEFTVARYAHDGDLLALTLDVTEEAVPMFPAWQFTSLTEDGVLPYLGAVLRRALGVFTPVELTRWMTTPHPSLVVEDGVRMSPRVWLLYVGDLSTVLNVLNEDTPPIN